MFCGLGNILLGTTNITPRVERVMIVDTLGEPTSAQLFLKAGIKLDVPAFEIIEISDVDDNLLFGGRVEGYPENTEELTGTSQKIIARDWSVECGYRQVKEHYVDWKISDIYKSLIQKYLPEHTTFGVTETLETATLRFNGTSVNQCLSALSDLMGWSWSVSSDRDHYFGPVFVEKALEDITDDVVDTSKGRTTTFKRDYTTLANRVWVEGGVGNAKNFTEQYIGFDDLETTVEPLLREAYPYQIPVWYGNDGVKVFKVFDRGDGVLENGRIVQVDCGKNEDIAGQKIWTPVASPYDTQTVYEKLGNSAQFQVVATTPGNGTGVIADFDAIYLNEPDEFSDGGYVYVQGEENTSQTGFIGSRLRNQIDPDEAPTVEDKLLGYMIRYKRKMQISYVSDVSEESVSEYGVQIDLPKVSRPAITDWSILYKYADYLLTKHKNPPLKGKVTVYRFKNGEEVYKTNLKSGQLVDIDLCRFGTHNNVKLTKVTHEITPECWRTLADSTLDPYLYSSLMADVMRRIHQLEHSDKGGDMVNSVSTLTSSLGAGDDVPMFESMNPDEDYGFGLSDFGASEWEGEI